MMIRTLVAGGALVLLAGCGETRLERTLTGAGIGVGTAAIASASLPWGAVIGAGAGYLSR